SPTQIAERVDEVFSHSNRMQAIRESARQTIVERYEVKQSLMRYRGVIGSMVKPTADRLPDGDGIQQNKRQRCSA
ncbi:MAG TPA: hypothetical protein VEN78_24500, partial [Bradyrhizobium sp.]|nr:hypothetical protein [Bradyrhizobium sp.]